MRIVYYEDKGDCVTVHAVSSLCDELEKICDQRNLAFQTSASEGGRYFMISSDNFRTLRAANPAIDEEFAAYERQQSKGRGF